MFGGLLKCLWLIRNKFQVNVAVSCVITNLTGTETFAKTDIKLYVPVVTLSTQGHTKLLQQLKFGFKRSIYWNTYPSKVSTQEQNQYLDYLVYASFKGAKRLFVWLFWDGAVIHDIFF